MVDEGGFGMLMLILSFFLGLLRLLLLSVGCCCSCLSLRRFGIVCRMRRGGVLGLGRVSSAGFRRSIRFLKSRLLPPIQVNLPVMVLRLLLLLRLRQPIRNLPAMWALLKPARGQERSLRLLQTHQTIVLRQTPPAAQSSVRGQPP